MGKIEFLMDQCSRIWILAYSKLIAVQSAHFGRKSRVTPPLRFRGIDRVSFGDQVLVERNCWIQTHSAPGIPDGIKLVIGNRVSIGMGSTISAAVRIELEDFVLIARNVYIADHAHAFEDVKTPIVLQGITELKPVKIGRGTWLGQNVCVLPGVTIGQHCIIGANSVVKSSIPDFSIAVGTPARVVKRHNPETNQWERVAKTV